ncbi:metallophosphoesterase [Pirellula staleyi DSM 6068]|uniref:Metallophosphoesterase n=1 Tax=Pirellula staleyi (strain ATCC 27377 / DSM 6068 / ICPB 4128) TaxID=530564 RepID=D2QW62_PIRSD|nr:metallophosphoesterase [Pirellula staleyi]ADB15937.1 metallophosphoesterase [Pirellula staleyi DSM 6068]
MTKHLPPTSHEPVSRRQFLTSTSLTAGSFVLASHGVGTPCTLQAAPTKTASSEGKIAFFVAGDTHFLAQEEKPEAIDETSAAICGRLVETLNRLPGETIPAEAGGGTVIAPRGLIHTGDIIDTGDKQSAVHKVMQRTEFAKFEEEYGVTGTEGRLKYPVYEVFGNHDSPRGEGHALDKIAARSKKRKDLRSLSKNGLHFSWDWNGIHFINLGLIVGSDSAIDRKRRYAAAGSLEFLLEDLRDNVADPQTPIVITHHIDIARYTTACDLAIPAGSKEWDPCDVQAFYRAIKDHNIAAIFYGHTHARSAFLWDGVSPKAERGIQVFNADNASHFSGGHQAFFYVEMDQGELVVREYQTKDSWQTASFTSQVWRSSYQKT